MKPNEFQEQAPGELKKSPDGFWTFVPNPLPPPLEFPVPLVGRIADAERALGELAGIGRYLPNAFLLIRPFLRREAVLSSRIEGTVTRLDQLMLFEVQSESDAEQLADLHEVLNYVTALNYGLEQLRTGMPLCLRLLREVHSLLMDGAVRGAEKRPGEFRQCPVMIGRQGQSYAEARFVPPHHSLLNPLLADLERFLNKPGDMPLVVQLALAHYQFEAIHPFMDGNGRIGRLLITLMLCERKCLPEPFLYLSAYLERHNDEYRDHLLQVSQRGTWNEWIDFIAVGLAEQSRDVILRAQRLLDLQQTYRDRMQRASQSSGVLRLVDQLFTSPFVTINGAARLLEVTHRAATQNVDKLIQQDILKQTQPGRKTRRVFYAPEILNLLNADSMTENSD